MQDTYVYFPHYHKKHKYLVSETYTKKQSIYVGLRGRNFGLGGPTYYCKEGITKACIVGRSAMTVVKVKECKFVLSYI